MIIHISTQKAVALSKKFANCKVPPIGESYIMPYGVKLHCLKTNDYILYGYAQDYSDLRKFMKDENIVIHR